MASLLHMDTSISDLGNSVSRQLTALFAETWKARHGSTAYRYRDLVEEPTPLAGAAYASLGQRVERDGIVGLDQIAGMVENAAEEREWALTSPLVDELLAVDTIVIGVPMYNFSIPAALKAWIDRVAFPGAFLCAAAEGPPTSRLRGTRIVVITARGGAYGPGTPRETFDFQMPYLRAYLTNLGVAPDDLHFVHAELTRTADIPGLAPFRELAVASLAAARTAVRELAAAGPGTPERSILSRSG